MTNNAAGYGIISLVTVMQARFVFSSNSRLSVRASHDCDKHEKRQVGGFLLGDNMKTCGKCQETKPLSEFPKHKGKSQGVDSPCLECKRKQGREYRTANPEKAREFWRKYRTQNPEKRRETTKAWVNVHLERMRELRKRYVVANPEKIRASVRNRRALRKGANGKISAKEWRQLKAFYNYTCLCCEKQEPEIKLTLDHIVPLIVGGANILDNAQPLCRPCNSAKGTKTIDYRPKARAMNDN